MKNYLVIISIGLGCLTGSAQDMHFSQFDQTPQLINPATTGVFYGKYRAFLNHKSQWVSLGAPYQTTGGSVEMAAFRNKWSGAYLGIGLNVFNDAAGDSKFGLFTANLSVSAVLQMDHANMISVGIQGGIGQRKADINALVFENQFNGSTGFNQDIPHNETAANSNLNSFMYADFAVGAYWEYYDDGSNLFGWDVSRFSLGASYYHVTNPELTFLNSSSETLDSKLIIHGSFRKDFPTSKVSLVPSGFYAKQGPHTEILAGMLFRITFNEGTRYTGFYQESALSVGGHMRFGDAFIPSVRYQYANWVVGVSYDMTTSEISNVAKMAGGLEVSLSYADFDRAIQKKTAKKKGKRQKF